MDLAGYDLLASTILLLDSEGRVEHVNAAADELFGLSHKQLVGSLASSLFNADTALKSRLPVALTGKFGVLQHDLFIDRYGLTVPVRLTLAPLHDQPWTALLEVRALERYALLDRTATLTRELAAQRESLRNLGHEVKNPLGGIRAAAQLLATEPDRSQLHEYCQVIVAEVDRLAALVDSLTASGAALDRSPLNIHEICERVYMLMRAEFGSQIEFVRDYDASAPELSGDSARLLQALLNMARNAAQAVTEADTAGRPTLVLRTRIARHQVFSTSPARLGIVASVVDNGPGVPDELRGKIFHPLISGRANGAGLGLCISRELVQQHGGMIEFDSRPGRTEFRMILPLEAL